MSTEAIIKENQNNPKLDPIGLGKTQSGLQISNLSLSKVYDKPKNRKKLNTFINNLQEKLRKKKVKKKLENRIVYGIFVSVIAVLFYVST